MADSLIYLSRSNVRATCVTPREAREAILAAFRDHAAGLNRSLPKSMLALGPGHGFQGMVAASSAAGLAALKWVSIAPVPAGAAGQGVHALICLNDYASGAPLAVMDGDEITLIRTAAMSAAAASRLGPSDPKTIAMIGCGAQAHAHLDAFLDLYPGLDCLLAMSRSRASAERLAASAAERGLATEVFETADAALACADIVISMAPGGPGFAPFLDARLMRPVSFASAVDTGRSWLPASLPAFDVLATDSLTQSHAPYDVKGDPVTTCAFSTDLAALAGLDAPLAPQGRSLFCFKGFALADLALAAIVLAKARGMGLGVTLER